MSNTVASEIRSLRSAECRRYRQHALLATDMDIVCIYVELDTPLLLHALQRQQGTFQGKVTAGNNNLLWM